jgi:quercetin dioxygenase-like cupin family protein
MPVVEKWNPAWGELTEAAMRQRLEEEGYRVSKYHYPPGTFFSEHTHAIDKKDVVLDGQLEIGTPDGVALLGPGDMIEIPAGTPHTAEVVGERTVVSLDATRIRR